jgi:hypothetical protein
MVTATRQQGYSFAEAADLIAAPLAFVEEAIARGVVSLSATGRVDEAGLRTLRRQYSESGEAMADLIRSSHEEGWYDISPERLRELGVIDPEAEGEGDGDSARR